MMRRREFIAGVGGVAASAGWPLAAGAQQPGPPVVGFLHFGSLETRRDEVAEFIHGLNSSGFIDGRNVEIEYRWAEGRSDRVPALAADLVQRQVAVIVASSTIAALAAKAATRTIPIVFSLGADPVKFGLVESLNRPGGNATGVSFLVNLMVTKQFEILSQIVPKNTPTGFLVNPINPNTVSDTKEIQDAAAALGRRVLVANAGTADEIAAAFATFAQQRVGALFVDGDPYYNLRREQIIGLAAQYKIPAMYVFREFPTAGGLMSYGTSVADAYRLAGAYAGRILSGAKPADLPVQQSTKFEFVINLKTAKVLGLDIPPKILALADEVIE